MLGEEWLSTQLITWSAGVPVERIAENCTKENQWKLAMANETVWRKCTSDSVSVSVESISDAAGA